MFLRMDLLWWEIYPEISTSEDYAICFLEDFIKMNQTLQYKYRKTNMTKTVHSRISASSSFVIAPRKEMKRRTHDLHVLNLCENLSLVEITQFRKKIACLKQNMKNDHY